MERLKTAEPNVIDAVFDLIDGDNIPRSLKVIRKSGTLVGFGCQSAASGNVILVYF